MFLCIYYMYFLWFSSKPLFAIARYSLRYSLLASGKNTSLFTIARYLKSWWWCQIVSKYLGVAASVCHRMCIFLRHDQYVDLVMNVALINMCIHGSEWWCQLVLNVHLGRWFSSVTESQIFRLESAFFWSHGSEWLWRWLICGLVVLCFFIMELTET